jgi:hypothetical protein
VSMTKKRRIAARVGPLLEKPRGRRRYGNLGERSVAPTLVDEPNQYKGYTITFELVDTSPELWRADIWVGDVLVWPVFETTKMLAMARAVQVIDTQQRAQQRRAG